MENKYYTPNIEDIRVGYETTIRYIDSETDEFKTFIITKNNIGGLRFLDNMNGFRTPYLTKEQIEGEGWIYNDRSKSSPTFFKGNMNTGYYQLRLFDNTIEIKDYGMSNPDRVSSLYFGKCPSINELRYICKLLKIK